MTTDWILIRRAAAELERALRGLRVVETGELDDGRTALRFAGRGRSAPITLAIDAFGSPPLVTLDASELALRSDPGWLRTAGTTLRTMRLTAVSARHGDRVIVLTFGSASRFGVEAEARLVLELVPRYGNVVVLRDRLVVAAAKQFSPAENEARSVQTGLPYEPPPLPSAVLDDAGFVAAVAAAGEPGGWARALGGAVPLLPRLLAGSVAAEIGARTFGSAAELAAALRRRADEVLAEALAAADATGELFAYVDAGGASEAVHVVPLAQFAASTSLRPASLLEFFAAGRAGALRAQLGGATQRRRAALSARIERRARATSAEVARVDAQLADVAGRERAREIGDALFTHLNEVATGAASFVPPTRPDLVIALDPELDAKANAQRYYARYRKAADALPHLELRRAALTARLAALDELAFEVERADGMTLVDLERDLDRLEGRTVRAGRAAAATQGKRRAPLRIERASGARIYVGRSPLENVEVTFTIGRPDDLWFHARGIPGSHVVLQPPPGADPTDDDLDAAAHLAAAHSKARANPRVDVDYTERKHVRKQRGAGPGLVWYTHARTRVGLPAAAEPELQPMRAR
jgi:predicted ribosome quality control (RQC) complex YloA/Tae2 family protein